MAIYAESSHAGWMVPKGCRGRRRRVGRVGAGGRTVVIVLVGPHDGKQVAGRHFGCPEKGRRWWPDSESRSLRWMLAVHRQVMLSLLF